MRKAILFAIVISLVVFACKDPYQVKTRSSSKTLLVVEGYLNTGPGNTTISLSHSYVLDDTSRKTMESGANVTIEGKDNSIYLLPEVAPGIYSAQLPLPGADIQYRLHIKTSSGKEYLSDYASTKITPPIDSINWVRTGKGVTIYANTHDQNNNTHYYQYLFTETWETHAHFISSLKYDTASQQILPRSEAEQVYQCWKSVPSSNIFLASSAQLQSDVIFEDPLVFIPAGDEKLSVRYSILVRQLALTKEAYDFFSLMKKNTESLGTVFDPLPSQVTGNIHNTADPKEQIIGLFYASSEVSQRIFIDNSQVPFWGYNNGCYGFEIKNDPDTIKKYVPAYQPYQAHMAGIIILGYYVSDIRCTDCTYTGGSTVKPSFW